jgi:hypothetical protein
MRKKRWFVVSIIFTGAVLLLLGSLSFAQDDEEDAEPPEFYGVSDCRDCHRDVYDAHSLTRHTMTFMEMEDAIEDEVLLADFEAENDVLQITFPDESEPRKLTTEDVAYTIGSGRYVQRYLYATEAEEYFVLPVQWNSIAAEWEAYPLADTWPAPEFDFMTQCVGCHVTGLDLEDNDWVDEAVQCEACHGPGSVHVEAADDAGRSIDDEEYAAIINSVVVSADSQVCGQCHNQGIDNDGVHRFPVDHYAGLALTDNYTVFSPAQDDFWWTELHARENNMQYNEWLLSAHADSPQETFANIPGADESCLECHSADYVMVAERIETWDPEENEDQPAPDPLTVETAQHGVTCISCHNVHPPEDNIVDYYLATTDIYAMCTDCHADNDPSDGLHYPVQQMFEGASLIEGIEGIPSAHFTTEDGPDCAGCHMPEVPIEGVPVGSHTMAPVAPDMALNLEALQDTCTQCHAEQAEPVAMQALIDDLQASTESRVTAAREAITDDTPDWVSLALDFIDGDSSGGVHNHAYTDRLLDSVEAALQTENAQ